MKASLNYLEYNLILVYLKAHFNCYSYSSMLNGVCEKFIQINP